MRLKRELMNEAEREPDFSGEITTFYASPPQLIENMPYKGRRRRAVMLRPRSGQPPIGTRQDEPLIGDGSE